MTKIYLAARYSRRLELVSYKVELEQLPGFIVQARWLDGSHQISDTGEKLGDEGETLVENGTGEEADALRRRLALDDYNDVMEATVVICFTEPPRTGPTRGGRHVELGLALAKNSRTRVIVVGYRENLFCCLPQVIFFKSFPPVKLYLQRNPV